VKKGGKLYIHKVLFISKLSLGLVLAVMIVKTAMLPWHLGEIFVPSSAAGTESVNAVVETGHTDTVIEDYSVIARRNIFGSDLLSTANKSLLADSAAQGGLQPAEGELGLALVGTIAGSPVISRAIIKDIQTSILGLYKTDQTVAGASIESIEKDAVILLHNGQRKALTLKTGGDDIASHTPVPSPQSQRIVNQTTEAAKPDLPLNQTSEQIVTKMGQVESVLGKAVIEPYVVKGQVEGLKITGLEGMSAAKDLGLKNGDIIRVVNGQQVTSKQKAYQIFKKARGQAAIDIELLRGNESQKLSFTFR
jgi:type II secretion system protein C